MNYSLPKHPGSQWAWEAYYEEDGTRFWKLVPPPTGHEWWAAVRRDWAEREKVAAEAGYHRWDVLGLVGALTACPLHGPVKLVGTLGTCRGHCPKCERSLQRKARQVSDELARVKQVMLRRKMRASNKAIRRADRQAARCLKAYGRIGKIARKSKISVG